MGGTGWALQQMSQAVNKDRTTDDQRLKQYEEDFFTQLQKLLGTQSAMARNTVMENYSRGYGSPTARNAAFRGVDYRTNKAAEDATLTAKNMAWQRLTGERNYRLAKQQLQLQREAQDQSFWDQLVNLIGAGAQGAGYAAGMKLFG